MPDHLPRDEEVLSPGENCAACGGALSKLGEDVTEELEYVPGRFQLDEGRGLQHNGRCFDTLSGANLTVSSSFEVSLRASLLGVDIDPF